MTETRTDIPTLDTDYLNRLLVWAETEHEKRLAGKPSEWDQEAWFTLSPEIEEATYYPDDKIPEISLGCGTACCLAGKVGWDAGGRPALSEPSMLDHGRYIRTSMITLPGVDEPVSVDHFAEERLGLTEDEAGVLFSGSNTIEDLRFLIPLISSQRFTDYQTLADLRDEARAERGVDGPTSPSTTSAGL